MNDTPTTDIATQPQQDAPDMYMHVITGPSDKMGRLFRRLLQAGFDMCRPQEARVYVAQADGIVYWATNKPSASEIADQATDAWARAAGQNVSKAVTTAGIDAVSINNKFPALPGRIGHGYLPQSCPKAQLSLQRQTPHR